MREVHPTVQILLWSMLVLLAQHCEPPGLLLLVLLCCAMAWYCGAAQFLRLLYRTRWIALSLLLIYAWVTPGQALLPGVGQLSPTWDGVFDGVAQLARLLCALAGLAVLLSLLSRERLIGGLYALAYPLGLLGLSREQFAVRLALTLEYGEAMLRGTGGNWRTSMEEAMLPDGGMTVTQISLYYPRYGWLDVLLLVLGAAVLAGVW